MRSLVVLACCFLALAAVVPPTTFAAAPCDIVLFVADDHGYGHVGHNGNAAIHTPNIDHFAAGALAFTHAFSGSPSCVPSRATLYSGLMPLRHGAYLNHSQTYEHVKTLPAYLQPLGYRVVLANKTHVAPREVYPFEYVEATLPPRPDRDRRYRLEGLDTAAIDRLLADHRATRADQPLCLVLGESSPHVMWQENEGYDASALPVEPYLVDTPATRDGLARYYSDVSAADRRFGEVLTSLDRHGFADALVIYTADQGPEWPHCKWNLYDGGLRVPFFLRWPRKAAAGASTAALTSLCDVLPTLIEAAGGAAPTGIDGRSFLPVVLGRSDHHRDELFAAHSGDGVMNDFPARCVRTPTHKLILNLKPSNTYTTHFTQVADVDHGLIWRTWVEKAKTDPQAAAIIDRFQHRGEIELYDLAADPDELNNLAALAEHAKLVADLRSRLATWMRLQGDEGLATEQAGRERLEAMKRGKK